jgi:DNA-binding response OmpR family regulator
MVSKRILVVDDEEGVCRSVKKVLARKGCDVMNALNVEEAVKMMDEGGFDLVITDLMMPKTSGMELLELIRENYPELDVIMITGYASIETAVKATKLGVSGYLPKPFTPEELTDITEKAFKERETRQSKPLPRPAPAATPEKDDQIDVDLPFSAREIERSTSPAYVESLTRSDVPLAKKTATKAYCHTGKRDCVKVVKDGRECPGECPIAAKEKRKGAARPARVTRDIIDVDMPFLIGEVERITGPEYIQCLDRSDMPRAGLYGRNIVTQHTALVIDDEPIVCHSIRKVLARQSCAVEEAFDVDVAMKKLQLNTYDLVILDLKMPKRSGMDVLTSIRNNYPDTPVIMVSGFASIQNAIQATTLGATNFLPKPFTPEELTKMTQEVLVAA